MEGIWKEVVVAWFEILPQYLDGGTEENHKGPGVVSGTHCHQLKSCKWDLLSPIPVL